VRLSAAGSLLLERAEAITQLAQQTGREISERRLPAAGHITLGVPPAAGRLLISPYVERFQRIFPQATLHIREGVSSSLQEWLLEKRIDIALLHNPPHLETLEISPLLNERMLVIGPPPGRGKVRKTRTVYRVRDLADLPLILPNTAHSNRRLVEQAAAEHGVRLRIKVEADSVAFVKALVEKGHGYTILTYEAVQDEVTRKRLTAFPIMRPPIVTKVTIVTLRDRRLPKLTHDAATLLHEVCSTLVRNKQWAGAQLARRAQ